MNKADQLIEELRQSHPDVHISVVWSPDPNYVWDGDGPDPLDDGYVPHDVAVTATTIVEGEMIEGNAYLGGCYEKLGEPDPEIHGYFEQMLKEALVELGREIERKVRSNVSVLVKSEKDLLTAAKDVVADLKHYVSTHGPGPDRRLAALEQAIERVAS